MSVTLRNSRCPYDETKDIGMGRLSWTIMVDAKCSHTCLCKREAEGAVTTEEENVMRTETELA